MRTRQPGTDQRHSQRHHAGRREKAHWVEHHHRSHGKLANGAGGQVDQVDDEGEGQQCQHRAAKIQRSGVGPAWGQPREGGTQHRGGPQRPGREKEQVGRGRKRVPVQRHLHDPHDLPQGDQQRSGKKPRAQRAVGRCRLPAAAPGQKGRQAEGGKPRGVVEEQLRAVFVCPLRQGEQQHDRCGPGRCEKSFRKRHGRGACGGPVCQLSSCATMPSAPRCCGYLAGRSATPGTGGLGVPSSSSQGSVTVLHRDGRGISTRPANWQGWL